MENELKKRWVYPYRWRRVQNDLFDGATQFIYSTKTFEELLNRIKSKFEGHPQYDDFFNYALNRWYNFHSAKAVEAFFCEMPTVKAAANPRDKLIDFYIQNIAFDLKTTVYPRKCKWNLEETLQKPEKLAHWLYENQSKQGRRHYGNRLFLVLYRTEGEHWKLKAELNWLKEKIEDFINTFNPNDLISLSFDGKIVQTAIIFAKQ